MSTGVLQIKFFYTMAWSKAEKSATETINKTNLFNRYIYMHTSAVVRCILLFFLPVAAAQVQTLQIQLNLLCIS